MAKRTMASVSAFGLDALERRVGEERLLGGVRDEGRLREHRGHPGGPAEDAVVVRSIRARAVLRAGVPVGGPLDVVGGERLDQLLVHEPGRPLRLRGLDLEVGLGTRGGADLVGVGVVVDRHEDEWSEARGDRAPRREGDAVVARAREHDRCAQRLELALGLLGDGEVHVLLQRAGGPHRPRLLAAVSGIEHDVGRP